MPEEFFGSGVIYLQLEAERHLADILIEPVAHSLGEGCRVEHGTDFGIVYNRPRIQVQRTDKHLFAVKNEGFGVQAGLGGSLRPLFLFALFFA